MSNPLGKAPVCPRCGLGRDTDGDGDCQVCGRFDDKRDVVAAIFRMLKKGKKP